MASVEHPLESVSAEAERRIWLEQYLRDNRLCTNGYEVAQRKPVLKSKGLLGDIYDVYYEGRCK